MSPRRPKTRASFYRPVETVDDLELLEDRWRQDLTTLHRIILALSAVSLLLIALNLIGTAFDSTLSIGQRAWSLFPVLSFSVLLAPLLARDRWLRSRALAVQRSLLGHRGLLGRESAVRAAEDRIGEELAARGAADSDAAKAFERARDRSAALHRKLAGIGLASRHDPQARRQRRPEERQLITSLDTYEQALGSITIEATLDPNYFSTGASTQALERAERLLRPTDEHPGAQERSLTTEDRPEYSVAVMPFADLSADADQEYFSNGLSEELISALTKIRGLRVIARSSSFSFRQNELDPTEIGQRLRVDALIRGSVRKAGSQLRVTVQLVDTSEARLLWSDRYEGEMDDVFAIQDQLTASLIDHLSVDQRVVAPARLTAGRTDDVDAYHFYLRGRHLWNKRTPADLRDSVHYFEEAIARDPNYALAHSGLADSHILLGYYSILAPGDTFPLARRAAERALEIDDTLAEAHCSLAFVLLLHARDWQRSGVEFARTLELNPGYATAHHWFAEYLALSGRPDEARTQASEALKLDPVSPIINVLVGWVDYYGHSYEEAIEGLEAALAVDPSFAPADLWLGLTYEQLGRGDAARQAFQRAIENSDRSPLLVAALARLFAEQGETEQADALLEELRAAAAATYVPAYYMAAVHSGYGESNQALEWLETSVRQRESWAVFLNVDPIWDPYRKDPRFEHLVEEIGLPAGR